MTNMAQCVPCWTALAVLPGLGAGGLPKAAASHLALPRPEVTMPLCVYVLYLETGNSKEGKSISLMHKR